MTIIDVQNVFNSDERCRELLMRLRWPYGAQCPRCKMDKIVPLNTEKELFYCKDCDYQFSVTVGTIFNDSHLPLNTWFMAVLLLVEARKGISANQMKRTLSVSYKTAWYLCHRIRAAMATAEREMLDGTVEMDETYVGGKTKRGIIGSWHKISAKHLPAYLAEMEFRFNRRKREDLFIDTLRHMVTAPVLTFEKLTA